ncbi:MAG: GLPGLI family protein [Mesonia sp.]|uniref:GLPGLI family protein n=1 Tax=Mesonia sp. TaxID=1960830 RepID=UPI003F99FCE7
MKYIFFLVFVLIICKVNSQNNLGGKITFGHRIVELGIDTSAVSNDHVKSVIVNQIMRSKRALEKTNELYQLTFNINESLFESLPILDNDYDPILSKFISKMKYYHNLSECSNLEQIPVYGNLYIVDKEPKQYNWKLINKTKKIAGFNCRLAVTSIIKNNKSVNVKAWYTPSIPVSLGPKGFNGLPGMILAVEELGNFYYAIDVDFNENIKIKEPKKGKTVSEQDFKQIVKGSMKKMRGE